MGDQITFVLEDGVRLLFELVFMIMMPILISGLVVGVFQAATQIQEMTLSFIPKIIILLVLLEWFGPLMTQMWVEYATKILKLAMTL
ncbi:flagellar biosynthetic protein FliQ [Alteromonas macleodii]|uniref:flagellar biosynthetic protein FliQ n=1 Tax=Alteromonas macleodii TaxID=28108 RepID=UPI0031408E1D|tara:strand:+ start:139097 stop:139357 length:261 start_codon:yes stop_codon:yes gene_type:complete